MDLHTHVAYFGGRYYALFDHARAEVMQYYNEDSVVMFGDFLAVGVEQIRDLYDGVDPCIRTVQYFVIISADPVNLEIQVEFYGYHHTVQEGVRPFSESFTLRMLGGIVIWLTVFTFLDVLPPPAPPAQPAPPAPPPQEEGPPHEEGSGSSVASNQVA